MNHPELNELFEYADGTLDDGDADSVARHISVCDPCRRKIDEVRGLMTALQSLPRELTPGRDLRPPIITADRSSISSGKRGRPVLGFQLRRRFDAASHNWLRAAAVIVLFAASTATVVLFSWRSSGFQQEALTRSPSADGTGVMAGVVPLATYAEATHELLTMYQAHQPELDPETRRIVQRNLSVMDAAIRELERAHEQSNSDAEIARLLDERYRSRLDFLRSAVALFSDV